MLNRSKAQNAADKSLMEKVLTVSALHESVSQLLIYSNVSDSKELVAERTSLNVPFWNFRADLDSTVSRRQTASENNTKRANEKGKERQNLFVVEKGLRVQLQDRKNNSKELEDLQYKLDSDISLERQSQNTVSSVQVQLWSLQSIV